MKLTLTSPINDMAADAIRQWTRDRSKLLIKLVEGLEREQNIIWCIKQDQTLQDQ